MERRLPMHACAIVVQKEGIDKGAEFLSRFTKECCTN